MSDYQIEVNKHRFHTGSAAALLLFVLITSGHFYRTQKHFNERIRLRGEYADLMRSAIQIHFIVTQQIPDDVFDVTANNWQFRNPQFITRVCQLERDNFRSFPEPDMECILTMEERAYKDVMPIKESEITEWKTKANYIQKIINQAQSDEIRLRHASDLSKDLIIVTKYAYQLIDSGLVPAELVKEYLESTVEFRRLHTRTLNPGEQEILRNGFSIPLSFDDPSALVRARSRLEDSIQALLKALSESLPR